LDLAGQQIAGNIRGIVSDPSAAIVQSAAVTAKQIETGLTRVAIKDHQVNTFWSSYQSDITRSRFTLKVSRDICSKESRWM
jgi:hypothetical protein